VLVHPFDVAIPGGFPGTAASFARRIARNTQLLLLEESHIGRVLDPAGGSWFVEDLTGSWPNRRGSTSRTSKAAAVSRRPRFRRSPDREVAERRTDDIAHRRTSAHRCQRVPDLAEPPLPQSDSRRACALRGRVRGAARPLGRFLRKTGSRPQVLLLPLGRSPSTTSARRSRPTCSLRGIEAVTAPPAPQIAVICGTDARTDRGLGGRRAATPGGVTHVLLAGRKRRGRGDSKPTAI
jgi:methylmalonyl-CoA mutase